MNGYDILYKYPTENPKFKLFGVRIQFDGNPGNHFGYISILEWRGELTDQPINPH